MFSPIRWLKPRLKSLCVGFGAADITLVMLSILGWCFFFDIGFRAQHDHKLLAFQTHYEAMAPGAPGAPTRLAKLYDDKADRPSEDLRLKRTLRACGLTDIDRQAAINQNFAGPAALIGGSMSGYFIVGVLLVSISSVSFPAARRVICMISLAGEGISTLFLIIATFLIGGDQGLCPTEFFFDNFQPVTYLMVFVMIFVFTYKTYEVTVIILYLSTQTKIIEREGLHHSDATSQHRASMDSSVRTAPSVEIKPRPRRRSHTREAREQNRGNEDSRAHTKHADV